MDYFDEIFEQNYKLLCVQAYFLLKDEQAAKDIVQNLFVDLWEKEIYLRLNGNAKGYLLRCVRNKCLNHLRAIEKEQQCQSKLDTSMKEELYDVDLNEENLYTELGRAVNKLPEQRRKAVEMVYLSGKKYQDAADSMGISINSLKTHLRVGLKNLRETLTVGVK